MEVNALKWNRLRLTGYNVAVKRSQQVKSTLNIIFWGRKIICIHSHSITENVCSFNISKNNNNLVRDVFTLAPIYIPVTQLGGFLNSQNSRGGFGLKATKCSCNVLIGKQKTNITAVHWPARVLKKSSRNYKCNLNVFSLNLFQT